MACDLCDSTQLVDELKCQNTRFRGVRKVCIDCGYRIEEIRMKHAYSAWEYGKKDWHERLCIGVKRDLKKLYRRMRPTTRKE